MKNLMILSYDVTNPTNLNILEKTIKSRLSYLADTFSSVNNSIFFFACYLVYFFKCGMGTVGRSGVKNHMANFHFI